MTNAQDREIARKVIHRLTGNSLTFNADLFRAEVIGKLHASQRRIFDDPHAVRVAVCGRRWGKTYLGATECTLTALAGGRAWWVAPVHQIALVGWREMLRRTREIPNTKIYKGEGLIELPSGGEIYVKSAHNPDNLRGEGLDLAIMDESAFIDSRVLPEIILPMLDKPHSRLLLIGTPSGRNWYYQEWLKGLPHSDERDPDYSSYQLPTSDNPLFPASVLERNRRAMSDLEYRQEHEAEFLAYQGLVYPEFNRRLHVTEAPRDRFTEYVAGVDWGFANPTVILIFGVDSDGRMHAVHEEYERQIQVEEWAKVGRQLQDKYHCSAWFCDPSEPDFIRIFQDHSIPAQEATNDVLPGIQAVKARLEKQADDQPRLTFSPKCIHTAAEFESYMWMEHSRNGLQDKPRKANDHTMDAMRYAAMGVNQYWGFEDAGTVYYADDSTVGSWWD